jgi:hypothetical protein
MTMRMIKPTIATVLEKRFRSCASVFVSAIIIVTPYVMPDMLHNTRDFVKGSGNSKGIA